MISSVSVKAPQGKVLGVRPLRSVACKAEAAKVRARRPPPARACASSVGGAGRAPP